MEAKPSYRYSFSSSSLPSLMSELKLHLPWQKEVLSMFGRDVPVPRLVAFVANEGVCYRYSGKDHHGTGWPAWLLPIKAEAEALSQQSFNSVLLNWYRDGEEYMGWHSDNEKVLEPAPVVAMLSLGATRDFLFRLKVDHKTKHSMELEHGSWLIMGASTQVLWQHSLPVRKRIKEERISLTFRLLL
ncbi:alpha-ketoglutarate-dependent dioxygenase AlkB family protein [Marinomonas sp. GJ51-6]|uniref:alpha-ketoglutarate-dependent dioxygenase AlkB family protein n=1 Tax=Marinomonas sp. GJ51-6 TaxID=2992802 RepID=UPI002934B5B0|nr:alpha-ketoglutarate-dependent dioxygenase AlkB [Marinomonas sp. GJ51-6]WOD07944.1 alpha-ketoglutarate-dependent dioxygenase AlkB [Marinomonas sp. GJ51-6]